MCVSSLLHQSSLIYLTVQVKTCLRFTEVTWFLVFCSQESWFFGRGWVVIHETLVFKESKGILRRNDSNYEMSNLPLSMCMLFGIAQLMLLNIHQKLKVNFLELLKFCALLKFCFGYTQLFFLKLLSELLFWQERL